MCAVCLKRLGLFDPSIIDVRTAGSLSVKTVLSHRSAGLEEDSKKMGCLMSPQPNSGPKDKPSKYSFMKIKISLRFVRSGQLKSANKRIVQELRHAVEAI